MLPAACPTDMHATSDHYSEISTVSANWGLGTLGRYDTRANVYDLVAKKTGDVVRKHPDLSAIYLNASYPGILNNKQWAPQPAPNTELVINKRTVSVRLHSDEETTYTMDLTLPDKYHPPEYFKIKYAIQPLGWRGPAFRLDCRKANKCPQGYWKQYK